MALQTHHPSTPLELVQGREYQALVRLQGPLACFAGAGAVSSALADWGFDNVQIFDAFPSHFNEGLKQGSTNCGPPTERCCRWVSGRWIAGSTSLAWPSSPAEVLRVWSADEPGTEPVLPEPVRPTEPETPASKAPQNPREARAVLAQAFELEGWTDPNEAETQAILSIARFEGGWGGGSFRAKNGGKVANRNNWGAIHCTSKTPPSGALWDGCVEASDTKDGSEGTRYVQTFRGYPTPTAGARDLLRFLKGTRAELRTGDADAIAARMKVTYRYGATVDDYASAILSNAKSNVGSLGVPLAVYRGGSRSSGGASSLTGAEKVAIGAGILSASGFAVAFFARSEQTQTIAGGVGVLAGLASAVAGAAGKVRAA